MKVNEIFTSIEGEGLRAGKLCTFIRFTGCNLRCAWCDTTYSFDNGTEMPIEAIISAIPTNISNITLTGGEPLLQGDILDLIDRLVALNYDVNIETNGAVDITPLTYRMVKITADYKLPSSKMESRMDIPSLSKLRTMDVLKFVIGSKEDMVRAKEIILQLKPRCHIYLSTVFGSVSLEEVVQWMKDNADDFKDLDIRIQVQLHKIIWKPDTRGV